MRKYSTALGITFAVVVVIAISAVSAASTNTSSSSVCKPANSNQIVLSGKASFPKGVNTTGYQVAVTTFPPPPYNVSLPKGSSLQKNGSFCVQADRGQVALIFIGLGIHSPLLMGITSATKSHGGVLVTPSSTATALTWQYSPLGFSCAASKKNCNISFLNNIAQLPAVKKIAAAVSTKPFFTIADLKWWVPGSMGKLSLEAVAEVTAKYPLSKAQSSQLSQTLSDALTNAQAKARDAYRIASIKQIDTALTLYYQDQNPVTYPVVSTPIVLKGCLLSTGFSTDCPKSYSSTGSNFIYMSEIPQNPSPGGLPFTYISTDASGKVCTNAPCNGFQITFALEVGDGKYAVGKHTATQQEFPDDIK